MQAAGGQPSSLLLPRSTRAAAARRRGEEGKRRPAAKVLMGKPIKTRPGPMRELDLKMGTATVAGKVFAFECRETRRPGMWRHEL